MDRQLPKLLPFFGARQMANRGSQQNLTQADITRALKAAHAAGLTVFSYVTTKGGIRVITSPTESVDGEKSNPWDRFLSDGKAE